MTSKVASALVTVAIVALVVVDVCSTDVRSWWLRHAFVTDTVVGLLVLSFTVLVADQVVAQRSVKRRARATAAQAAIVLTQAARAANAVTAVSEQGAGFDTAADEVRNYLTMLLTAAPMLLDSTVSQTFLESAQHLAAELARTLAAKKAASADTGHIADAVEQLRGASRPLLHVLDPDELRAAEFTTLLSNSRFPGEGSSKE